MAQARPTIAVTVAALAGFLLFSDLARAQDATSRTINAGTGRPMQPTLPQPEPARPAASTPQAAGDAAEAAAAGKPAAAPPQPATPSAAAPDAKAEVAPAATPATGDRAAAPSTAGASDNPIGASPPADAGAPATLPAAASKPDPAPARRAAEPEAPPAKAAASEPPPRRELHVAAGAGAFMEAYDKHVLKPFSERAGIDVRPLTSSDRASADLLFIDAATLVRKCAAGELVQLEAARVVPAGSGGAVREDFLDGGVTPCGIAAFAWSSLFVFEPSAFEKRQPRSLADVFDLKRFPGKRALPADGRGLFEALLIADGVAPDAVYRELESADGMRRALRRLGQFQGHIVWYDAAGDAVARLRKGEVAFALTTNGHAFVQSVRSGPLGLIWDGQVLNVEYMAIRQQSGDVATAQELLVFATAPEQLAAVAREMPYGPMRKSAIAMTSRHAVTGRELAPFLPTASDNLRTAVTFDPAWWEKNRERLGEALTIARRGPPVPTRP